MPEVSQQEHLDDEINSMTEVRTPHIEDVRVEPITDDDRERIRELLLQVQNLVESD